jgi:hypothetical protein
MLSEVSRVLRPGGLLLLCEWAHSVFFQPLSMATFPAISRYYATIDQRMRSEGIAELVPDLIPNLLQQTNAFEACIRVQRHVMPIGSWHSDPHLRHLGERFREPFMTWMESMRPFLRQGGYSNDQINSLIHDCEDEMQGAEGLFMVYYTFWTYRL